MYEFFFHLGCIIYLHKLNKVAIACTFSGWYGLDLNRMALHVLFYKKHKYKK